MPSAVHAIKIWVTACHVIMSASVSAYQSSATDDSSGDWAVYIPGAAEAAERKAEAAAEAARDAARRARDLARWQKRRLETRTALESLSIKRRHAAEESATLARAQRADSPRERLQDVVLHRRLGATRNALEALTRQLAALRDRDVLRGATLSAAKERLADVERTLMASTATRVIVVGGRSARGKSVGGATMRLSTYLQRLGARYASEQDGGGRSLPPATTTPLETALPIHRELIESLHRTRMHILQGEYSEFIRRANVVTSAVTAHALLGNPDGSALEDWETTGTALVAEVFARFEDLAEKGWMDRERCDDLQRSFHEDDVPLKLHVWEDALLGAVLDMHDAFERVAAPAAEGFTFAADGGVGMRWHQTRERRARRARERPHKNVAARHDRRRARFVQRRELGMHAVGSKRGRDGSHESRDESHDELHGERQRQRRRLARAALPATETATPREIAFVPAAAAASTGRMRAARRHRGPPIPIGAGGEPLRDVACKNVWHCSNERNGVQGDDEPWERHRGHPEQDLLSAEAGSE